MNACHFNSRIANLIFGKSLGVHQNNYMEDEERKSQIGKDSKSDFSTKSKSVVSKSRGARTSSPDLKNLNRINSRINLQNSDRKITNEYRNAPARNTRAISGLN